jgi:hypothetical protein
VFPIRNILGITAKHNVASQGVLVRAGFVCRKEQVINFQGTVQPIVFFEFHRPA